MKPRIYTDTSVLGGCEDAEFREPSCRLLEAFERDELTLVLSEVTLRELRRHPKESGCSSDEWRRRTPRFSRCPPGRSQAMGESAAKTFDCVQSMREIRDRLSAEIADMSYGELVKWFRSHRYADPRLQRLAEKAAQNVDTASRLSASR